jgi:D-alanyl-D-alanine carboxypeptidase
MMLVEHGKIGLDDPISRYIANTPITWHGITVRQLLSHTAGLREYGLVKCDGSELVDISKKVQFEDLIKSPLEFSPGEGTLYSDAGYFLLGLIIEAASGQTYREFLQDRIFAPLKMDRSSVLDQSAIIPKRVAPYTLRNGQLQNGRRVWQHELPSWYGVWSTVEDMAKFDVALSSHALLKQETLASMWAPANLKNGDTASIEGMSYGLGWFLLKPEGHLLVAHPGWTGTFILRFPDDQVSIILLTNLDAGSGDHNVALTQGILRLLHPELPKFRDSDLTK